ncbi:MAG: ATP synthase F1 subunit epsilon [Gemmatimonadota bacterium]|jgi:F-type H+-transporting ATPase subunit epsilon
MAAENLSVAVTTPERTIFEGGAEMVVAPAWDGEVGILRNHAPMMALLGEGTLRIRQGREERRLYVSGGFLQVADNVVSVLSEHARPLADEG